jgi:hypothetical protein
MTVVRASQNELLGAISGVIKETREDVKALMKHVTDARVKGPTPLIPGDLKKEDYPGCKFWNADTWIELNNGRAPKEFQLQVKGRPTICAFLEDEEGMFVSKAVKDKILSDLTSYWNDMIKPGPCKEIPDSWTNVGLTRKDHFRETFEKRFPILKLCQANWKADYLWINYLGTWRRGHLKPKSDWIIKSEDSIPDEKLRTPAPGDATKALGPNNPGTTPALNDPEPAPAPMDSEPPLPPSPSVTISSTSSISVSSTQATAGSKRAPEEVTEPSPKRYKGRVDPLMAPTVFKNARPMAKLKIPASLARVSPSF